jgi:hypothetical protein
MSTGQDFEQGVLQGHCHEMFGPPFFFSSVHPLGPNFTAEAVVSNMASNSPKTFEIIRWQGSDCDRDCDFYGLNKTTCRGGFRGFNETAESEMNIFGIIRVLFDTAELDSASK